MSRLFTCRAVFQSFTVENKNTKLMPKKIIVNMITTSSHCHACCALTYANCLWVLLKCTVVVRFSSPNTSQPHCHNASDYCLLSENYYFLLLPAVACLRLHIISFTMRRFVFYCVLFWVFLSIFLLFFHHFSVFNLAFDCVVAFLNWFRYTYSYALFHLPF